MISSTRRIKVSRTPTESADILAAEKRGYELGLRAGESKNTKPKQYTKVLVSVDKDDERGFISLHVSLFRMREAGNGIYNVVASAQATSSVRVLKGELYKQLIMLISDAVKILPFWVDVSEVLYTIVLLTKRDNYFYRLRKYVCSTVYSYVLDEMGIENEEKEFYMGCIPAEMVESK